MRRDLTTERPARVLAANRSLPTLIAGMARLLAVMALAVVALALVYQIPVTHTVDIGGYDSAYVQGLYDPERGDSSGDRPYLAGSDGSARWTRDVSYLLFPQAGLPAQVTLRLRGWRASGPAPEVVVLLNGARELGRFRASDRWEEHSFAIDGGLLKPNDVVIEIRSETAPLRADDARPVGVLLDRTIYRAGPAPITPYPAPLLYGALAAGMLYVLSRPTTGDRRPTKTQEPGVRSQEPGASGPFRRWSFVIRRWLFLIGIAAVCLLFFVLYRAQLPYPYPLRGLLPAIDTVLAALLALRYGPALVRRIPALPDGLALGGVAIWTAGVLLVARAHVTLSTPGVEKDFRVFALRSADFAGVFQADGFYNLGYPLLLRLARPFASDNPFLAGRLIAALSGALLLGAAWWLARRVLGRGPALVALLALALSPFVVEYALYTGTDMPFAALCTLALALLLASRNDQRSVTNDQLDPIDFDRSSSVVRRSSSVVRRSSSVVFAGLAAGMAFLVRHPGLLLLPVGWLALWWHPEAHHDAGDQLVPQRAKCRMQPILLFTLAFLLAIAPQLAVNITQTGQPLYNQQAKNIWLAVFGDGDWGRWGETADSITLGQVLLQDPGRFFTNWWANLRGYVGAGGEDVSEFGHAIQLRLLGFPANWLAIVGLLDWLMLEFWYWRYGNRETGRPRETFLVSVSPCLLVLLAWIAIYVLAINVGLALPRFFLPLAPVYALAAAWAIARIAPRWNRFVRADEPEWTADRVSDGSRRAGVNGRLIAGLACLFLLWGGFATGSGYVLNNQPADEVAAVALVSATVRAPDRLVVRVPDRVSLGKYSAIAHLAVSAPASDDPAALRSTGARYLLWSSAIGPAPAVGVAVGGAGPYTLYRMAP